MLVPLALTARLGAVTADLAAPALDTGIARRDAARARGASRLACGPVVGAGGPQPHGGLEGVEHGTWRARGNEHAKGEFGARPLTLAWERQA